jgi:predicted TIM-barrel fold metal-dependent hydrolase
MTVLDHHPVTESNPFAGRLLDLDSHLMAPLDRLEDVIGEAGAKMAELLAADETTRRFFGTAADQKAIEGDNVWREKGTRAPGAHTADTRLAAMDVMGVHRQLVFPDPWACRAAWRPGPDGLATTRHFNDFAVDFASADPDRLRPTLLLPNGDVDTVIAEAERGLAAGGRAFLAASGVPLGGVSPADETLDPLWARLAEGRAPLVLHIGGESGFLASDRWPKTPVLDFVPGSTMTEFATNEEGAEPLAPWLYVTMTYAPQNLLTVLALGGVFERHPGLRVAVVELGAGWVGPLLDQLDQAARVFPRRLSGVISERPSDYLRRQVRVTPFFSEPVEAMVERYDVADMLCYSSDYPHPEGGTYPLDRFRRALGDRWDDLAEPFHTTNGLDVLPD